MSTLNQLLGDLGKRRRFVSPKDLYQVVREVLETLQLQAYFSGKQPVSDFFAVYQVGSVVSIWRAIIALQFESCASNDAPMTSAPITAYEARVSLRGLRLETSA
jgi:hypothetical protein